MPQNCTPIFAVGISVLWCSLEEAVASKILRSFKIHWCMINSFEMVIFVYSVLELTIFLKGIISHLMVKREQSDVDKTEPTKPSKLCNATYIPYSLSWRDFVVSRHRMEKSVASILPKQITSLKMNSICDVHHHASINKSVSNNTVYCTVPSCEYVCNYINENLIYSALG